MISKIKGVIIFMLGLAWVIFVYHYDALNGEPQAFGLKAMLSFLAGAVALVNGVRIFIRK